jgi:hypothetical protein
MAFTENQAIAASGQGVCGIDAEDSPIKGHQNIDAGERPGKMGTLRFVRKPDQAESDFAGDMFEVFVQGKWGYCR